MKLSIALLGLLIIFEAFAEPDQLCGDYSNGVRLEEGCDGRKLARAIRDIWAASDCRHSFGKELKLITGTSSKAEAKELAESLCEDALSSAIATGMAGSDWQDLVDAGIILSEFFEGQGFLNLETGNLQQDPDDFPDDKYLYTGEDPRLNDHYPTTEESYTAGEAIRNFLRNKAHSRQLDLPVDSFASCSNQAAMCCWHRDRQYKDGNGNCGSCNCVDRDPADNTNLCWTKNENDVITPVPGDEEEGDLHCHGFAWSNDPAGIDTNTDAKWNNLFYVSMYDHLVQRGYVESIADVHDMCGCVEDMSPVSRADCTEALPLADYLITIDGPGSLGIEVEDGSYRIEFEACEGIIYNTQEEKNNDLSAFAYRLVLEGKMEEDTMYSIFDTLVGYENPNDNENEEACALAYFEETGLDYPVPSEE